MDRRITPGKVEYATGPALRGKYHVVESSDGVCLAECYEGSEEEQEANAKLYALAHNTARELYDLGYDPFVVMGNLVEFLRREQACADSGEISGRVNITSLTKGRDSAEGGA